MCPIKLSLKMSVVNWIKFLNVTMVFCLKYANHIAFGNLHSLHLRNYLDY